MNHCIPLVCLLNCDSFVTLSADPSALGHLDYESMSQQSLMEMVVSQMSPDNQSLFKDSSGNFLDLAEWDHVELNDDGTIREIVWSSEEEFTIPPDSQGIIHLEWLPDTIEEVWLLKRGFEGSVLWHLYLPTPNFFFIFFQNFFLIR